jgi:hypothetical protein
MRLPRKITGLLMAAGMAAGITAAAAPARADTPYIVVSVVAPGSPTGLCLEADPGSSFVYQVYTQPCDPAHNQAQQWLQVAQGGGVDKWVNRAIGWCLYTDTRFDGSPIALWPCDANISNTRWAWQAGSFGLGMMQSRISGTTGHCLTVAGLHALPGTPMQLSACATTPGPTETAQTLLTAVSPQA